MRRPQYTPQHEPNKHEKIYAELSPAVKAQIDADAVVMLRNAERFAAAHGYRCAMTEFTCKMVALVVFMAQNGIFND